MNSFHLTAPARRIRLILALLAPLTCAWGQNEPSPSPKISAPAAEPVPPLAPGDEAAKSSVENSVVKIFAQVRRPELTKPWTKQAPTEITGSGVVIEGKRILTNAHVVLYASEVQVQASQSGDKVSATVEAVSPGIDLAVLKLEDESFFEAHPPLVRVSHLPQIKDPVLVYGFPVGGTSLSITKGIVSRIEFTSYHHSTSGLRVQIDAAINPGNSGGPALVGDKVVGLAFSHYANAQNIGYIIPCEEIDEFLQGVSRGPYDGKPAIFDDFQTLENAALRNFLNVDKGVRGMVVNEPFSDAADYPLKKWDVVTKIGDVKIDDQGMVPIEGGQRVRFTYYVQKLAKNGTVPLTVVRAGKELKVELPVGSRYPRLIQSLQGEYPSYFIYGPVSFTIATDDLINSMTGSPQGAGYLGYLSIVRSPLATRRGDKPAFDGEQLVVVSGPFFPHKLAKGYSNQSLHVVETVNGTKIKSLLHLVEVLRDLKDEFVIIAFSGRNDETLVFPRTAMIDATEGILTDNGVRSLGSPDVMAVWNAAKPEVKPATVDGADKAAKTQAASPAKSDAKPKK